MSRKWRRWLPRIPAGAVTQEKMALAKKHAVYMHCMPIDCGHQADGDVIDGPQSIIYKQAENPDKELMALTMTPPA